MSITLFLDCTEGGFFVEQNKDRQAIASLPSPGLADSRGWQEVSQQNACISDIKGQSVSREKLDYFWNILNRLVHKNREQRVENRIDRIDRSFDFAKTWNGNYIALDQDKRGAVRNKELLKVYEGVTFVRKIKKSSVENDFKIKRGGGKKKKSKAKSKGKSK